MEDFKGTPGPWIMDARKKHINNPGGLAITSNEVVVASVNHDLIDKSIYQYTANAMLIAAAPDLLDALMEAKETICSLKLSMNVHPDCVQGSEFNGLTWIAQDVEDKIQAVITKALGEVQNG